MPFRKSKRYAGRRKRRVPASSKAVAYKALKMVKRINQQVERKCVEEAMIDQNMLNTGVVVHLTDIAQGDDNNQRTGNLVYIKYNQATFTVFKTGGSANQNVKVALVWSSGATALATSPHWLDCFTSASPISNKNPDIQNNLRVLKQFNIVLTNDSPMKTFRYFVPVNKTAKYYSSSSGQTTSGQLYLMYISDQSADYPQLTYRSNTVYTDI